MKQLKASVAIEGGRLINEANLANIRCVNTQICRGIIHPNIGKDYREVWRVTKDDRGYAFTEVTHGCGICGSKPTLRDLILHVLICHVHLEIFVVDPIGGGTFS